MSRTRRPRTAAQVRTELARIDRELEGVTTALEALRTAFLAHTMSETAADGGVSQGWNLLHDAQRALEAERREVEENRVPLTGATAELVAANRD